MKNLSIKTVVAIGIGAALFFLIGRFVSIPTGIPNTNIQLQYAVLALFAALYGPLAGFLIAFLGSTLIDITAFGNPWWSWILAAGVFGLILGFVGKRLRIESGIYTKKDITLTIVSSLIAVIIAWGILAPIGDIIIYQQPTELVFVQGLVAGLANAATVAIAGTALLAVYAKSRVGSGTLTKD
ncbi:ECF-type riboflavin transporter substrate-binding protein [Streptococcus merionis]|uniref:ECF-type riboflavin transporter substrate-binding protein n=1 Tax=Streptococcus merionis TaxID=400065 RepID=UPI0026ECA61B|nr:ECF-type riboflavin transporter substrate-binding protein [Streptococcus merionis]